MKEIIAIMVTSFQAVSNWYKGNVLLTSQTGHSGLGENGERVYYKETTGHRRTF